MNSKITQKKKTKSIFFIIIFFTYIFTNAFYVIFETSSVRDSMIIGIVGCLFILLLNNNVDIFNINKRYIRIVFFVNFLIMLQFLLSMMLLENQDVPRLISSWLLMGLVLIVAPFLSNYMETVDEKSFDKVIVWGYYFLTVIGLVSLVLIKFNILHNKNMIIFSEPSHFALVYLPFLLYRVYLTEKIKRVINILLGLFLAFGIGNLTLLVGVCSIMILAYWKKKVMIFTIILMAVLMIKFGVIENIAYFRDRLEIDSNTMNLSTLVWLSGWERAYLAFTGTYGVGIGLQQMGIIGDLGIYMDQIYAILNGNYLNMMDGGSTGSKIICELGILGIVFVLVYVIYFIKTIIKIIRNRVNSNKEIYCLSIFFMMFVQLFVRGVGYFEPYTFMFFAAVYWLVYKNNTNKVNNN